MKRLRCYLGRHEWAVQPVTLTHTYPQSKLIAPPIVRNYETIVCRHCWKVKPDA